MIHRLIYLSSTPNRISPDDIQSILAQSRQNNARDHITGLLIFHDGSFLQILEGEKDEVLTCYRRINRDTRHSGCIILQSEDVPARQFGEWDMAYVPFAELPSGCRKSYIDLTALRDTEKMRELLHDKNAAVFVTTFLESFRDSRLM